MSKWTPAKNGDFILCSYAPWLRSGRNVTAENVFTYIPLVDDLLTDGLTYVGALRSNKPHLPDAMKTSNNCEVHNSLFGFNDQMTLVSYVPKPNKYVVALSSMHHDVSVAGEVHTRDIILHYNVTKSGVDNLDHLSNMYTTRRKVNRWHKCWSCGCIHHMASPLS